jgi:hypothetical protein
MVFNTTWLEFKDMAQGVVVEMGDNNWLQDVSDVLITS